MHQKVNIPIPFLQETDLQEVGLISASFLLIFSTIPCYHIKAHTLPDSPNTRAYYTLLMTRPLL